MHNYISGIDLNIVKKVHCFTHSTVTEMKELFYDVHGLEENEGGM